MPIESRYPALSELDVFVRIWPGDGNLLGAAVMLAGTPVPMQLAGTVFRGRVGLGKDVRQLLEIAANLQRVNQHGDSASVELELFQLQPPDQTPIPGLPASTEFNNKRYPLLSGRFEPGKNEMRIAQQLRII